MRAVRRQRGRRRGGWRLEATTSRGYAGRIPLPAAWPWFIDALLCRSRRCQAACAGWWRREPHGELASNSRMAPTRVPDVAGPGPKRIRSGDGAGFLMYLADAVRRGNA
jgi:hypothetical protein